VLEELKDFAPEALMSEEFEPSSEMPEESIDLEQD
jgi:hypothetical protein